MSLIQFPPNPAHGLIFEPVVGLFYQYDAKSNSWNRLLGAQSLGLATPIANGLMSKQDYQKLQGLLVPPPQATLRGEECETTFKSGTVGLYSLDESLTINKNLDLIDPSSGVQSAPWQIHRNTAGYDFKLNLLQLIEQIEQRNQLRKVQLQGDEGLKGAKGAPGRDRLDTGPTGPDGVNGTNSEFDGTITTESIAFELVDKSSNKAIVDISSEEISEDENYLIITRANIGNPDACPDLVIPKALSSALLVAINAADSKLIRNQSVTQDCALVCRVCASSLHHLNIEPILNLIVEKYKDRIQKLKAAKEELVKIWLNTMVTMFNEQKSSLCCALENCRSRKRNERTRQYIETQRIQAAQADFRLEIHGNGDKQFTDMDADKNCPVPDPSQSSVIPTDDGVVLILDSKVHIIDPRTGNVLQSISAYLPPGTYVAEITACCANFNDSIIGNAFSGQTSIIYQAVAEIGSGADLRSNNFQNSISFPNLGTFTNVEAAKNAYQGLTITFEHAGGNISAWLNDPDGFVANNTGTVTITISSAATDITDVPSTGFAYLYRDEISPSKLLGRLDYYAGGLSAAANLGVSGGEINLTQGPSLSKDKASVFLYDGSDGLSLFFVAGEQANPANEQEAAISLGIEIVGNTLTNEVKDEDDEATVTKTSASTFTAELSIDGDSTGFAIGEIDTNSNYTITITPTDLSTMREFVASDPDEDITLAEGGTEGIGGNIAVVTTTNSASLFDINDVPEEFGGGNTDGILVDNTVDNQNVIVSRPIFLEIPTTFTPEFIDIPDFGWPNPVPALAHTPDEPELRFTGSGPRLTRLGLVPPEEPPEEEEPASVPDTKCGISEETSEIPRGTIGSVQDPTVVGISISVLSDQLQNIRYVLTDNTGVKYYSAFTTIDLNLLGEWQFMQLGAPIATIDPPEEFTDPIIRSRTLDLSLVSDQLTRAQLRVAESLTGISRLSYVQSILGSSSNGIINGRTITDIELEMQKMPIGTIAFGVITAIIGLPGAMSTIVIDNFEIVTPPEEPASEEYVGVIKRVVATSAGNFSGLASYIGFGVGFDSFIRQPIDITGNQYFTLDHQAAGGVVQITDARGYKRLVDLNFESVKSDSGQFRGEDAILVDNLGGVIYADGVAGTIQELASPNASILNTTHGDANDQSFTLKRTVASGLNSTTEPVMEFGTPTVNSNGAIDPLIYANFGNQWYKVGAQAAGTFSSGSRPVGRLVNTFSSTGVPLTALAAGRAGNSLAADRDTTSNFSDNYTTFYVLDENKIYTVVPETGVRTLYVELPENGFGLKIHPITKDLYYITDDLGTVPRSGTKLKRVDIRDLDENNKPIVKGFWTSIRPAQTNPAIKEINENDAIKSITFAPTVPESSDWAVYALIVSNALQTAKLVEIGAQVPLAPGPPLSQPVPTNSAWVSNVTGGVNSGNPSRIIITRIPPSGGCQMHYKQVQWYERGWRIGACCGALVEYSGTYYIVVKRSLGIDESCGGGESASTPCIAQYIDSGEGHPAIAWPTMPPDYGIPGGGGEEFLGLPTSGFVNFIKDATLSDALLNKIRTGQSVQVKGDAAQQIPFILFPAS